MNQDDGFFDESVAAEYDSDEEMFDPAVVDPAVDTLHSLAKGGSALEFGIGTGRIASPLAERGTPVHGIDLSKAMMKRIDGKPGAGLIQTTVGDFSSTRLESTFSVVYLVFNTIMNLTTQQAQVACFQNAARHLKPGGVFVIEVMMPRLQWLSPGDNFHTFAFSDQHWGIDEYDVATQSSKSHHMRVIDGAPQLFSLPFRYVWPSELDLMAQLAGIELVSRWQDWQKTPFSSQSRDQIAIWKKPH